MNPAIKTLTLALVVALAVVGLQQCTIDNMRDQLDQRQDEIGQLKANFDNLAGVADECTKTVDEFQRLAEEQADKAREAIEQAQAQAVTAGRRADAQRFRAPAVPGNACASAQQENREWMEARRAKQ